MFGEMFDHAKLSSSLIVSTLYHHLVSASSRGSQPRIKKGTRPEIGVSGSGLMPLYTFVHKTIQNRLNQAEGVSLFGPKPYPAKIATTCQDK